MPSQDHYQLLHITPAATAEEVRKAYRKMALLYHPDRNPQHPETGHGFTDIQLAYEILNDPVKRRAYDLSRHNSPSFPGYLITEPAGILAICHKLKQRTDAQPSHRINRDALQREIQQLLSAYHQNLLKQTGDAITNHSIVSVLLRVMSRLDYPLCLPLFPVLLSLVENDQVAQHEIHRFERIIKRQYYWDRYKPLAVFVITLLLCFLIYRSSHLGG